MPKILVADDNANIQKMVVLAFEDRGIQVITVGNGEAAVRRIPDLNPDLVLADIFMPVRNGYEVCEFVKKDERFSHVPVILLVGAFDPLDEKEARRVGADGVLKKPFVPPDPLIAMVMSALEKNPKVAAEIAKAREAKEAPPPEPVLEIPARPEPKPQPEFPEPTPEEAALVYGFGKGVRALDEEPSEAVPAPKAPVAEAEETDDADFDGASTSRDWRRNAMDFEVPAGSANMPAFSGDEHLEPPTFPSEKEHPPRRVRMPEPVEESDPVVQDAEPAPSVAAPSSDDFFAPPAAAPEPAVSAESEAAPEVHETPVVEAAAASESAPSPEPAAAHWMDAIAPSQPEHSSGGWMNSLSSSSRENDSVATIASEAPISEPAEPQQQSSWQAEPVDSPVETKSVVELPESEALFPVSHAAHEDRSTQEAPAAEEKAETWFAPAPSVFDSDPVSQPVAVASSAPDQGIEFDSVDTDAPVSLRDPALVESPAVHVTPEPLLLEDGAESRGPSEYGSRKQDLTPLHSFFAPASGDPVVEEPVAQESSAREEAVVPSFDAPAAVEPDERIPTGPPPNREALASIPFLTPPPEFHQSAPDSAASGPNVDEVVRRVLERLEPQIHDLLSQGVLKPLVENLLQSELAKKGK